jgi:hypothetical protein
MPDIGEPSLFAALGYSTHGYGGILFPNYEEIVALVVGVGAVIGELPFFVFWLLIRGVNVQRYNERAQQLR